MKTKTYDFRKFMRNEHKKEVKPPIMSLIPVATAPLWSGVVVSAESATEASIQTKMMSAFDPLLQLIQGIAYPVALSVILAGGLLDRKSTRLNSSHVAISYAVFCLKKKKNEITLIN